jgi:hypothetical protein
VGYNSISISQLSLQYVAIPVKATLLTGASDNPTSDPVYMAFMPQATQVPQLSDWKTAIWATRPSDILNPYAAACLVGPGGTITLTVGTYVIYVKVTDNPEVPVLQASLQLEVY